VRPPHVEIANEIGEEGLPLDLLRKAATEVLLDHGRTGTLSIAIVDDPTIQALHRDFLDHDEPTDCLSFDLSDPETPDDTIGEVVVSLETARREALRRAISTDRELLLYVVHAVLHLCGHDDGDDEARAGMERIQNDYLERFAPGVTGSADGEPS
jgi:probable rRNA maturation factor